MQDIDFVADTSMIPVVYQYKAADFNENVKIASDIAREFKSGKLDPRMTMRLEKQTKQMLKRGMLIH